MDSDSSDSNISFVLRGYRGLAYYLFTGVHVLDREGDFRTAPPTHLQPAVFAPVTAWTARQ